MLFISAGGLFFTPTLVWAKDCTASLSPPGNVSAVPGPGLGQVTVFWNASPQADHYALAYGLISNNYIYGADDIGRGNIRSFTVSLLTPGKKYYFRLAAASGCSSSPFSAEVSAVASGSGSGQSIAMSAPMVNKPDRAKAQVVSQGFGKQKLTAVSGPKTGEVTLHWVDADMADNYHLVYGTNKDKYIYGALNLGKVNKFTVRSLAPGRTYYFALVPLVGNRPLYTTDAVAGSAKPAQVQAQQVIITSPRDLYSPPMRSVSPKVSTPGAVTVPPVSDAIPSIPAGQ